MLGQAQRGLSKQAQRKQDREVASYKSSRLCQYRNLSESIHPTQVTMLVLPHMPNFWRMLVVPHEICVAPTLFLATASCLVCASICCQTRPSLLLQVILTACKARNPDDVETLHGRGSWGSQHGGALYSPSRVVA